MERRPCFGNPVLTTSPNLGSQNTHTQSPETSPPFTEPISISSAKGMRPTSRLILIELVMAAGTIVKGGGAFVSGAKLDGEKVEAHVVAVGATRIHHGPLGQRRVLRGIAGALGFPLELAVGLLGAPGHDGPEHHGGLVDLVSAHL